MKNKSAGDGCRDKIIEKTILRAFRARTFSRSQGQRQTSGRVRAGSVHPDSGHVATAVAVSPSRRHRKPAVPGGLSYLVDSGPTMIGNAGQLVAGKLWSGHQGHQSGHQCVLASVIVCLRSIPKTPVIIDVRNRVLAGEARDSGDSTPAIRKTRSQQRVAGAGRPPPAAVPARGALDSAIFAAVLAPGRAGRLRHHRRTARLARSGAVATARSIASKPCGPIEAPESVLPPRTDIVS